MRKDECLNKFRFMLEFRDLSSHTVSMYTWILSQFLDYFPDKDYSTLTVDDALQFVVSLKGNYASSTINSYICAIRYFYEVVLDISISRRKFPYLVYHRNELFIFSKEQLVDILNTADIRLRAFILLGVDAGLRVSEVASLRTKDIDSIHGTIFIYNSKRKKSRKVYLSDVVLETLREYWRVYRPKNSDYLFPPGKTNSRLPHIHYGTINQLFKKHTSQFEFYCNDIRFHNLRDTFATTLFKNGTDVFLIKKLLGHSSLSSTARYIQYDMTDIKNAPHISDILGIK